MFTRDRSNRSDQNPFDQAPGKPQKRKRICQSFYDQLSLSDVAEESDWEPEIGFGFGVGAPLHPEKDTRAQPEQDASAAKDAGAQGDAMSRLATARFAQLSAERAGQKGAAPGSAPRPTTGSATQSAPRSAPDRAQPSFSSFGGESKDAAPYRPDGKENPQFSAEKAEASIDGYLGALKDAEKKAGTTPVSTPQTPPKSKSQKALEDLGRVIGETALRNALSFVDAGVLPEPERSRAAKARSEYVTRLKEGDAQAAIPPLRTLVHLREQADPAAKAERAPARGPDAPDLPYLDKQDQAEDQRAALKSGPRQEAHLAKVKTRSDLSATFVSTPPVILARHEDDPAPKPAPPAEREATPQGAPIRLAERAEADSAALRNAHHHSARQGASDEEVSVPRLSEAETRRLDHLRRVFARPALDREDPIAEPLQASGAATALTLEQALRRDGVAQAEIDEAIAAATPLLRRRIEEALELEFALARAEREPPIIEIQRGRAGVPLRGPMAGASPGQLAVSVVLRANIARELREIRRLDPTYREPASAWPIPKTPTQSIRLARIRLTSLQNARWEREAAALAAQFSHLGPRGETIAGNITAGIRNPYFIGRYRDLARLRDRGGFRFPVEIHHLNQASMMGGRIPLRDGLGVTALGNPTRGASAQHRGVHRFMEENFFSHYREGGRDSNRMPTFRDYNSAAETAYRAAGFPRAAIRRIMDAQRREQRAYGFRETDPLPRLPGPVRVPKRHR